MLVSRSAAVTCPWPARNTEHRARSAASSSGDNSWVAGMPHYALRALARTRIEPLTPAALPGAAPVAKHRVSEPPRGEQGGPGDRVHFLPLRPGEPDLGQHTARSGVPIPDRGPQTFVPRRSRQSRTASEASVAYP